MKKRTIYFILIILFSVAFSANAHGGRTDSNGGHKDKNNVSGLGSYHYHHGMGPHLHSNGVCPYDVSEKKQNTNVKKTTPTPTPTIKPTPTPIAVESIEIKTPQKENFVIGEVIQLECEFEPANAENKNMKYQSKDEKVAIVNDLGQVKVVSSGETEILLTTHNGISSSFKISAKNPQVEKIEIIAPNRILINKDLELQAIVSPKDVTNGEIEWSINNLTLAKLEGNILKPVEKGFIIVKAKASNGVESTMEIEIYSNSTTGILVTLGAILGSGGLGYYLIKRRKI